MYNFLVIVAVAVFGTAMFTLGTVLGDTVRQNTIVEECKNTGMYLDRNLIIECRVGVPRIVSKPDSL